MIVLRQHLGDELRRQRQQQGRTLRQVSASARVSLGYLSEIERGQKEASSELLGLDLRCPRDSAVGVLRNVSDDIALAELRVGTGDPGAPRRRRRRRASRGSRGTSRRLSVADLRDQRR